MPQRARPSSAKELRVVIACESVETLDGLELYLRGAGVLARSTRALDRALMKSDGIVAVVLFADDFAEADVIDVVTYLVRDRSGILPVVVTAEPLRFTRLVRSEDPAVLPVILPKPAWGWTILDTIRARMRA